MQQWLGRPAFSVRLEPGDRPPYEEAKGPKKAKAADLVTKKTVRAKPAIGETPPLDFPDVQHVTLSNGVKLAYAQRTTVPVTQLALSFDAGYAADARSGRAACRSSISTTPGSRVMRWRSSVLSSFSRKTRRISGNCRRTSSSGTPAAVISSRTMRGSVCPPKSWRRQSPAVP